MNAAQPRAVELGSLKLDGRIGQGGQGSVHRVLNRRINETGDAWNVVYKQYSAAMLPALDGSALGSMVTLLDTLDGAQGRWLCERTAWPAAVVKEQGRTRGFLMRAVPDRFRFHVPGLTAQSSGKQTLATVEFLLNDDAYAARIGLQVSDYDRALLLADLADVLARLHRLGIAVGDLSPKNLLFTLVPRPECFLIDCDAMRLRGANVLPQAETPDWQAPDGEEKATRETDVYKFGLLAIRLFAREQNANDPAALAGLGSRIQDLARSSLDADPGLRPTPVAWADALAEAAPRASSTAGAAPAAPQPAVAASSPPPAPAAAVPPATTPSPTPTAPSTKIASNSTGGGPEGLMLLAGLGLLAGYNWHSWINLPNNGGQLAFHAANALSLMLFAKAFWIAVVGLVCTVTDEYPGNVCGALLGFTSFCCFTAGYERLGNDYGIFNVHPLPGYGLCVAASVAVVVIGVWKCVARYQARHP